MSFRRGFTFTELTAVVLILSVLAAVSFAVYTTTQNTARNRLAQDQLTVYVSAQTQRHATHASFASSAEALTQMFEGTVTTGPSTGPTVISSEVTAGTLAAALLSNSGACLTVVVEAPSVATPDIRLRFDEGAFGTCDAAFAATASGGTAW